MPESVRFALIGAGGIAQSYLQAFETPGWPQLVAIADARPEAAKAMAELAGCPSFSSHEAILDSVPFDAVVICTPPNTHEEISTYFLQRGIHVLCEKPFTLDSTSAKRMIATAQQTGLILTMASKFRYVEDVIRAKSIVASGILGEIILFENAFTSRVDMTNRWNSKPSISGGGVLIDNGTHSVDIMRYFLGPLHSVHAVEGKRVQGLQVEDTVRPFTRSTKGVMGGIDLSWSINKELESFLNIYGSQGTVSVGWRESKYRQQSSRDWIVFGKGYNKTQAFRDQILNFAGAIRGREQLLITADDALASVEVIEAAYRSMRSEAWTEVAGEGI